MPPRNQDEIKFPYPDAWAMVLGIWTQFGLDSIAGREIFLYTIVRKSCIPVVW